MQPRIMIASHVKVRPDPNVTTNTTKLMASAAITIHAEM
jgi:hypothetical protein